MDDTWRNIEGYEVEYSVNSNGDIFSHKRNKLVKHWIDKLGYHRVCLSKNNKKKNHLIHRLVWSAFNGAIPKGMQVNHIDENPSNNSLSNLNLLSPKGNTNWGTCIERRSKSKQKRIMQLTIDGKVVKIYNSLKEAAEENNIPKGNISSCCTGKRNSSGGFKWRYAS